MPHIHCYLAKPLLVGTMFVADILIGLAYFFISLTLWTLVIRIKIPFSAIVLCFGVFISACGATHFMEVWTLWNPDYWAAAFVKVITAIASVGTGIYLFKLRNSFVKLADSAKLGEQRRLDLEMLTRDLERRVEERAEALKGSEARFREVFEKSAIGMAQVSLDGRWLQVNPRLCEIVGYSEQELLSESFTQITHPDDLKRSLDLAHALQTGELSEGFLEKRYIHKNGAIVWAKVRIVVSRNSDNLPCHFVTSIDDISELKELQVERERLYQLPHHLLCVLDENSKFKSINAGFTNVLGYSAHELKGKSIWEFIHPEDLNKSIDTEQKGYTTVIEGFENRFLAKDGSYCWLRWTGAIVDGRNYGAAIDISEIKIIEQNLRESEERFRSLANSIPQLAWMTDAEGYIHWYNDRWYEYTGTTFQEMKGWGWDKVHHPDHVERVVNFLAEAWKKGQPWELTFPIKSRTGEWCWFLTRAAPIRDSLGNLTQWFGTNTDITEQLHIQDELQKAGRELRHAITARDEFLSIASHELKTPLTSLKLQTQLRQRIVAKGDEQALRLEKLRLFFDSDARQIERLSRLIDDMLDISRITTGKLTIHVESFDLCDLVVDVLERHHT